jgi:hypothetical protein
MTRFNYAFSKWLAAFHPELPIPVHREIVDYATEIASNIFLGVQLDALKILLLKYQDDKDMRELLDKISDIDNGWRISYDPME